MLSTSSRARKTLHQQLSAGQKRRKMKWMALKTRWSRAGTQNACKIASSCIPPLMLALRIRSEQRTVAASRTTSITPGLLCLGFEAHKALHTLLCPMFQRQAPVSALSSAEVTLYEAEKQSHRSKQVPIKKGEEDCVGQGGTRASMSSG